MPGLYIGGTTGFAGKNLLALALAMTFKEEGYRVGFMKPVGFMPRELEEQMGDEDAVFIQDALGLNDELDLVTPVLFDEQFTITALTQGCSGLMETILSAHETLSREKDVMLICGSGSFLHAGKYCDVAGLEVAQTLQSKVILVDRFFKEFYYDYLVRCKELLGEDMIGAVFNCVPEDRQDEIQELILPLFQRRDIRLLGSIPDDQRLNSLKIRDLARRLQGKIISAPQKTDHLVDDFLIGTMQVENFMTHFKKRRNSAVIVGGDRSDLQLVALEGRCPCLILTGNLYPNDLILSRSDALQIPVIVVREDTYSVAKEMEKVLDSSKFREPSLIDYGVKLVKSNLDIAALKTGLGLEA